MKKQMEGDNKRRRALARQAREQGRRPSEAGTTLGASKQVEHLDKVRRSGPVPAGRRKPDSTRGGPAPPPVARSTPTSPRPDPGWTGTPRATAVGYRELVTHVAERTGSDFDEARQAAEATVLALARALDERDRERLLDAVPTQLKDLLPLTAVSRRPDLSGFLDEVARISQRTPEQARYQAEATLAALAAQDRGLVDSLELPADLRGLLGPPEPGGGTVDPTTGHTAPLTDDELRAALAKLPYWSGTSRALSRTIELPPRNLDRVLRELGRLESETGRAPRVARPDGRSAVLIVRTTRVGAVTALDVDLAHRVDAVIDEAGAGIASG